MFLIVDIKVYVDIVKVVEDKVFDRICLLDREFVRVVYVKVSWVVFGNEFLREIVGLKYVFVVDY